VPGVVTTTTAAAPVPWSAPVGWPLPPPAECTYGLDIETDTAVGGLDPAVAAVIAVAVSGPGCSEVLAGPEPELLGRLDSLLAELPPGLLVTWNGSGFDLPFLADRAARHGVPLGLQLRADPSIVSHHAPLAGHRHRYRARWYHHDHLDAYRLYRADLGRTLRISCSLKSVARLVGLVPVEVDRRAVHRLSADELARYVLSDAELTRQLVLRRWPTAARAADHARER
jgi:DNA polymerase elongation subunit (family B)